MKTSGPRRLCETFSFSSHVLNLSVADWLTTQKSTRLINALTEKWFYGTGGAFRAHAPITILKGLSSISHALRKGGSVWQDRWSPDASCESRHNLNLELPVLPRR